MTADGRIRTRSLFMLIVIIVAGGCSLTSAPVSRIACGSCEEPDRFVRLQDSTKGHQGGHLAPFSHPLQWSAEQWKPILRSVQVQLLSQGIALLPAQNGPTQPAFTPVDVDYLSESLSGAFTKAQPSEMVVFGLTSARTPQLTDITTGAWFVKDAQLHLLLGNYREAVTMPSIRALVWQDPLHQLAGARYEFVAGPHQRVLREDQGIRTLFHSEVPQLVLTYSQSSGDASLGDIGSEKGTSPATYPASSLEKKLQRLKQLHDEGLITDEEYAAKKKTLLEGL